MYRFSRAIYLEVRDLTTGKNPAEIAGNRRRVLQSCERTMEGLSTNPKYFAHPAKRLFSDVRYYFPIQHQEKVFKIVDCYVSAAIDFQKKEDVS